MIGPVSVTRIPRLIHGIGSAASLLSAEKKSHILFLLMSSLLAGTGTLV